MVGRELAGSHRMRLAMPARTGPAWGAWVEIFGETLQRAHRPRGVVDLIFNSLTMPY